jgi:hypothetical protein
MIRDFEKARVFMARNARPLDYARWRFHFENGGREAVLEALSYYQNEDGGFGHALEADSWNPNSTPIQTWAATEILSEIGLPDKSESIVRGILRYLESGRDFSGRFWHNAVPSNNDYPHAPWWHTASASASHHSYNPTACLAGFILYYADRGSGLYELGCRIATEAFDAYVGSDLLNDMHTALCYIRLLEYCEAAGVTDLFDLGALRQQLVLQVKSSITADKTAWETGYVCKPSQFFNHPLSIFCEDNKDMAAYECDFILRTQLDDGSWPIPWRWQDYPEEWAISKNWWKANGIIINMLFLKGFGRLEAEA